MEGYHFTLAGTPLIALGTGALVWPEKRLLCVSDLHLGKSDRVIRRGGPILPPYEVRDTLMRLDSDILSSQAETIVCLGDSFDDLEAGKSLRDEELLWIRKLQVGRRWIWIEGNHDPGPLDMGGTHLKTLSLTPLSFRHIPLPCECGEIAGHFHPKVKLKLQGLFISKPCFLLDRDRLILPAYGTFTGGLKTQSGELSSLMRPGALAILTGKKVKAIPMPRV
ncbi:MAG: metallophosphoesterase [Aestuariivita sp.]|nr:metallophosphoesterase [Aestuariivita sp.]|tara:strand:- start:310 stop:975 length:666 start_codon:yes stop_codon:yes gene_type:complete